MPTSRKPHLGHRPHGFTLVELLIVISIIALLAAILFPVFSRVRENARRSSCQSNLKQIGLGILQYTQDYDEIMPNGFSSNDVTDTWTDYSTGEQNTNNYKWMDAVYPYVKSEQVFVCPSATKVIVGSSSTTYVPNAFKLRSGASVTGASGTNLYGSYGINMAYFAVAGRSVRGPAGNKIARIAKPAETVLSTDTNGNYLCGPAGTAPPVAMIVRTDLDPNIIRTGESGNNTVNGYAGASVARHLDMTNVLFCDGHVKATKIDYLNQTRNGSVSPFNNGPLHINFTIEDD